MHPILQKIIDSDFKLVKSDADRLGNIVIEMSFDEASKLFASLQRLKIWAELERQADFDAKKAVTNLLKFLDSPDAAPTMKAYRGELTKEELDKLLPEEVEMVILLIRLRGLLSGRNFFGAK